MSNSDDPYDPNRPPHPSENPNYGGNGPSNDWSAPQQNYGEPPGYQPPGPQQNYGQPPGYQPPGGPMMYHSGPAGGTSTPLEGNDIVAIVLSLFLPGVGHMILGQTTKGIVVLLVSVLTCGLGGLLLAAVALDAYAVATAKKRRAVGEWEFFPDLFK